MNKNELLRAIDLPDVSVIDTSEEAIFMDSSDGSNVVVYTDGHVDLSLSPLALAGISSSLGIPSPYIVKLPSELAAVNLNYWYSNLGKKFRVIVDNERQQALAFMRENAPDIIDIHRAFECIESVIGDPDSLDYLFPHSSLELVSFSIAGPETVAPVPGDIFRAGITFRYSPVDEEPMTIQGFNHRLVCSNGMYAVENMQMSRRHPADDAYEWIRANAAAIWENRQQQFEALAHAREVALPELNAGELIDHIYRNFTIPRAAREAVSDRILHEGAGNLYDLINHITYVASNNEELASDFELQSRLFSQAGEIASHAQLCPTCNRLL